MKQKVMLVFILVCAVLGGVYAFKINNEHRPAKQGLYFYVFSYTTTAAGDSIKTPCVYPGTGCLVVTVNNVFWYITNGHRRYLTIGETAKFP